MFNRLDFECSEVTNIRYYVTQWHCVHTPILYGQHYKIDCDIGFFFFFLYTRIVFKRFERCLIYERFLSIPIYFRRGKNDILLVISRAHEKKNAMIPKRYDSIFLSSRQGNYKKIYLQPRSLDPF